jgi:geranylgeranyl diphosphate synthase type II
LVRTADKIVEMLSGTKKELDAIILNFLPTSHSVSEIDMLYKMMKDYPSRGGKGLRGAMCLLWCELFGGKRESALVSAAALELFHNWILIHDDIEDNSDLRRGAPTLHKQYGIALSINAGDALHGKMWELLLKNKESIGEHTALKILYEFSRMLNETTEGQHMELGWIEGGKWDISEADYLLMVTKKSAWYTCISPARIGTILAGTLDERRENDILQKIVDFGIDLGISFQIIDDLLNLEGKQEKYGKEILGDIFEGKRTLALMHLLKNASREDRFLVLECLSKSRADKTNSDVERIFRLMRESGSLEYARKLASKFSESALSRFDLIVSEARKEDTEVAKTTRALVEFLTKRDF